MEITDHSHGEWYQEAPSKGAAKHTSDFHEKVTPDEVDTPGFIHTERVDLGAFRADQLLDQG